MSLFSLFNALLCLLSFLCSSVLCATELFFPLLCFSNTWLNVRCFPSTFYVRGICTILGKYKVVEKMENSSMCSSVFSKLTGWCFTFIAPFRAWLCHWPQGALCLDATALQRLICCWQCGGSSVTLTAPHPITSRFQILCSVQVYGFTQFCISHISFRAVRCTQGLWLSPVQPDPALQSLVLKRYKFQYPLPF